MADAPKPDAAKPPLPLKKGPDLDDDPGAEMRPKKPVKLAPTGGRSLGRGIIVASLLIMIAWVFDAVVQPRYVLAPVQTNENTFMYRLDQRTGAVHFCSTQQCTELPIK